MEPITMTNAIEDTFMVYKINDSAQLKSIDPDSRLKAKQQDAITADADHATIQDSVNLSTNSKEFEALKAMLQDAPEVNAARVLYFKAEIASGNYQIHSDKIAKNMLNNLETA